ncbi:MAG: PHP domain-containing protein [Clostridia bacterium]|nr:PHP domain-containing protein [Clostridia bacterium]
MIDLHMHTTYSDGTCSVKEILKEAEEKKLECISITDHDTCLGYKELEDTKVRNIFHGKIIPGCELKSIVDGTTIEILGYNVDTKIMNEVLPTFSPTYEAINRHESKKLYDLFISRGYVLDKEAIKFNVERESGEIAIIKELLSHNENQRFLEETNYTDAHEFYRVHMSNPNSPYFIDNSELVPKPKDVVEVIHKAGGLAFIPHVFVYGENSNKVLNALTKDHLVDGIECYYSKFTAEQTDFLLDFCKNNNYYVSGGSDYHGTYKPGICMGRGINNNLEIPIEIIQPWAQFI